MQKSGPIIEVPTSIDISRRSTTRSLLAKTPAVDGHAEQ